MAYGFPDYAGDIINMRRRDIMLKLRDNRGASIIFYCLSLTVLLAVSSLVADIGMMVVEKNRLINAVDASVLAGAQELIYHPEQAEQKVREFLQKNGFDPSDLVIEINESSTGLRVNAQKDVRFYIAPVIGFHSAPVYATASAVVLPVSGVSGARPFAIEDQELVFGETYVLKTGSGKNGNFGPIELGGNGAHVYYNNIVNGFSGRLFVGDNIQTEPGNMSGPTEQGVETLLLNCNHYPSCTPDHFEPNCARVITVVIVDSLDVNGRATVQVVGFASFFLEGVAGSGNQSIVTGKFIRSVTSGEVSETQSDYGLYGVKLME